MSLLLMTLLSSPEAQASSLFGTWPTSSITLNISTATAGIYTNAVAAMNDVASDIYSNASNFYWAIQYDDDASTAVANKESELAMVGNMMAYCGFQADGCMVPVMDSTGKYIIEADVYMYTGQNWSYTDVRADNCGYSGAYRPFKATLLHELGHAAGLNHNSSVYNIMGIDYTHVYVNGSNEYEYLGEDATAGLRGAYGTYGGEDIGLVHWKYTGASGQYSVHGRTTITSSTGAALATTVSGTETVYKAKRGDTVRMEYTVENNGSSSQKPTLHFYLSTDSTITSADTALTNTTVSVTPDTPYTTYTSVTLPARNTGTYYLGVLADQAGSITEIDESNNYTWTMIQIN